MFGRRSSHGTGGGNLADRVAALEEAVQVRHLCPRKWIRFRIIFAQADAVEEDEQKAHIVRL